MKRTTWIIAASVLAVLVFFLIRGPHISNALKKFILPELEAMFGRKVIAQQIYVNLFPAFIEAKGLKMFDENGERLLYAQRVKAYVSLPSLAGKRLVINRLIIREPEISSNRDQAETVVSNIRHYLDTISDMALKVTVKSLEIRKGKVTIDDGPLLSDIREFNGECIFGDEPRIKASAGSLSVKHEGWPEISGDVDLSIVIRDDKILVQKLAIGSLGSVAKGSGEYRKGEGRFVAEIEMLVETVKRLFGLGRSGEGRISARGSLSIGAAPGAQATQEKDLWKRITCDLSLDGSFYIQTLMELLGVKEKIEGFLELKGALTGPLRDLKGSGKASLKDANLYNVKVASLDCDVGYERRAMTFSNGKARLYNGSASVDISIALPVVDTFSIDLRFSDVDSAGVFSLIGWDPGLEKGKMTGVLVTAGAEFNPSGFFEYRSDMTGRDVRGRVRHVTGNYAMNGDQLSLANLVLRTARTDLFAGGTVNITKKTLDLTGNLITKDVRDLTAPHYDTVQGAGDFTGRLTGTFDNPVISGDIKLSALSFKEVKGGSLNASVAYKKDLLAIRELKMKEDNGAGLALRGEIRFPEAEDIFDFRAPEYNLKVSLDNAALEQIGSVAGKEMPFQGITKAELSVSGKRDNPEVSGNVTISNVRYKEISLDSARFRWRVSHGEHTFDSAKVVLGKSSVDAAVRIDAQGGMSFQASSDTVFLSDLVPRPLKGEAVFRLKMDGQGTIDNPSINLDAKVIQGTLRGKSIGGGTLKAYVMDRNIALKAGLLGDKIEITGKGRIEGAIPWEAAVEIKTGRYDAVLSTFLKDIPEDLILSMTGAMTLRGTRNSISATSTLRQLSLSMYGHSFANEGEISLELQDRKLVMDRVVLRSGGMSLKVDGSLMIGREYNLVFEGNTTLAPFKSLSARIGVLRGDAEFVLGITGKWDNPQLNGGVNITNGTFGLKEYPYRISSLTAYMYMDNDRIVLQKASGKLGGGDLGITGILYLKKFAMTRFYVEGKLDNILLNFSNEFSASVSGGLLYRGTPETQLVSGDILVKRAKYRERVEWKSWLLKTKTADRYKAEISNLEKAQLNIRITGSDTIFIDNNIARAAMSADMVLRGSLYRPVIFGRLNTKEGTLFFRNNEFRILHASADFSDPNRFNPVIDIAAETDVKGYKIRMNLEGQLDHFNMSLSSDPVLKEMDILALLTVGQTGVNLKGLEGGVGAGEATSFVTGKLQDVFEERMRTITGLDRLQVSPYVSKSTGTVEPRVTVSKRLLGEKMFVTYTTSVGSSEEQIIRIEYFLNNNVSLIGMRDERGFLGGDVRFRFEFR